MLAALLDLCFPAVCPLCARTPGAELCSTCREALVPLVEPCPYCGAPDGAENCRRCGDRGLPGIESLTVSWAYVGALRRLVSEAKAGASPSAVRACTRLLPFPAGLDPALRAVAAIVPVPPSPGRRPGPHLGTALAASAATRTGLPLRRLLRTTRLAAEQHALGRTERARNVLGLFTARGAIPSTVVLVDDLLTSGATLSEAARVLRQAGAQRVVGLVLARTAGRKG